MLWEVDIYPAEGQPDLIGEAVAGDAHDMGLGENLAISAARGYLIQGELDRDQATRLALADTVDVLFVGTGADTAHIPADLRITLEDAGIGVEAMATPAACRTYNVLLSEGRRVALAVIPV